LVDTGYLNLSLFFGRSIKKGKESHTREDVGDNYNKLMSQSNSILDQNFLSDNFELYHGELMNKISTYYVYHKMFNQRTKIAGSLQAYLPKALGGANLFRSAIEREIYYAFLQQDGIQSRLNFFNRKQLSYNEAKYSEYTPKSEVHSMFITALAKNLILDLIEREADSVVDGDSILNLRLSDCVQTLTLDLASTFKNTCLVGPCHMFPDRISDPVTYPYYVGISLANLELLRRHVAFIAVLLNRDVDRDGVWKL
jgi:hypothetical protein